MSKKFRVRVIHYVLVIYRKIRYFQMFRGLLRSWRSALWNSSRKKKFKCKSKLKTDAGFLCNKAPVTTMTSRHATTLGRPVRPKASRFSCLWTLFMKDVQEYWDGGQTHTSSFTYTRQHKHRSVTNIYASRRNQTQHPGVQLWNTIDVSGRVATMIHSLSKSKSGRKWRIVFWLT
jgi:hypothetical protein